MRMRIPRACLGRMRQQTERAVADADAALFLFDARAGHDSARRRDCALAAGDRDPDHPGRQQG